MAKQFDGNGFSKEPIDSEEAAKFRHLYKDIDESFVPMTKAELEAMKKSPTTTTQTEKMWKYFGPLVQVFEGWKTLVVFGIVLLFVGGKPLIDRIAAILLEGMQ
jgi:hypothetical protein